MLSVVAKIIPLTLALLGFCLLIVVHELGHFLFAKLFNIHTPTFSIGMGPKLIEKKIGETNFRVSALPLGGYVEIAGLAEVGQGEQEFAHVKDERSFFTKPLWQKLFVLLGGVLFNLIFAYFALSFLFMLGAPKPNVLVKKVMSESAAFTAGVQEKDRIIAINGSDIASTPRLLTKEITKVQSGELEEVAIIVERKGMQQEISVRLPKGDGAKPRMGIEFEFVPSDEKEQYSFFGAILQGIKETNFYISATLKGLKDLFVERSLKGAGPVMIISESAQQAKRGLAPLLFFLAIISINLAIMNLLPIPALDGGQLWFTVIEAILGRQIPLQIKNVIFIASWVLLLLLLLIFTYNDIKTLLGF